MMLASPFMSLKPRWATRLTWAVLLLASLAGCGGGNPLDNPQQIDNSAVISGKKLSLMYYQRCIQPILDAQIPSPDGGGGTNQCASSGCHNNSSGTGGALRVVRAASTVDLSDPVNTHDVVRATEIYRNFYSAQGVTVPGAPHSSRLLTKPLLIGVLHGGGLIFSNESSLEAKTITYWIKNPVPTTSDEFELGAAVTKMFNADGSCVTE